MDDPDDSFTISAVFNHLRQYLNFIERNNVKITELTIDRFLGKYISSATRSAVIIYCFYHYDPVVHYKQPISMDNLAKVMFIKVPEVLKEETRILHRDQIIKEELKKYKTA